VLSHLTHNSKTLVFLSAVKAGSTFFSGSKLVQAWCSKTILITNCYIFGSNICVLCTLNINYKHFVSMEMAPIIVTQLETVHTYNVQAGFRYSNCQRKLLKILAPNSLILPFSKLLKVTLFTTSRLCAAFI